MNYFLNLQYQHIDFEVNWYLYHLMKAKLFGSEVFNQINLLLQKSIKTKYKN